MLDAKFHRRIVQTLLDVPSADSVEGRSALLIGLPSNITAALNRSSSAIVDVTNIITQLDRLGRLRDTGERPLIIVAENALRQVNGTDVGRTIEEIVQELGHHYGGDPPSEDLLPIPEILVFADRDERLPYSFVEKALQVGKSVTRLQVPRIFDGSFQEGDYVYGTGWVVAPGLLFTNQHVVAARTTDEPPASRADRQAQAESAVAWFDYYIEGGSRTQSRCTELVCSDAVLDYALVRLEDVAQVGDRQPLPIMPQLLVLRRGNRLNIVQFPRGGSLRYAIRNNYYIGTGSTSDYLRYLTDTEPGSSGSPVLNDNWQVVGMHHAYRQVPEEQCKGEMIKYHNQGIVIHSILAHVPLSVRQEIESAQGWS
jgi:V8-like Glu-specific endopeptidase